jgi:hypothetical protein
MPATKSLFDALRPGRKKRREQQLSEEVVDKELDDALKKLADATRRNTEAGEKLRERQSSGKLKLVSLPPGE